MKKHFLLVLMLSFFVCFSGCTNKEVKSTYTETVWNVDYTVDVTAQTITDGTNTYKYVLNENSIGYKIHIVFPNESYYEKEVSDQSGISISTSNDYSPDAYVNGETLCEVLEPILPEKPDVEKLIIGVLVFIFGLISVAFPRFIWKVKSLWSYYEDEGPTTFVLNGIRIFGVIIVAFVVISVLL